MQEAQPEIVLHLAAQPIVRESYKDPVGTYETNVMGTGKYSGSGASDEKRKIVPECDNRQSL